MKREGLWLVAILVLVALSILAIFKLPTHYGLDIKGGARAVLQVDLPPGQTLDDSRRAVLQGIIERRLNSTGVAEPSIQPKGDKQFIIELPNVTNKDAIIDELGTTASMEFYYFKDVQGERNQGARYKMNMDKANGREVYSFQDTATGKTFRDQDQIKTDFEKMLKDAGPGAGKTPYALTPEMAAVVPGDRAIYFTKDQIAKANALDDELGGWNAFLAGCGPPIVGGAELNSDAAAHLDTQGMGGPTVTFSMKPKGTKAFATFTTNHVGEYLAILLDNRIISAPKINTPITGGETEINGGFANIDEAKTLSDLINAGALPVPMHVEGTESVEATLGKNAVKSMTVAGIVGLAMVLVFMGLYYLLPGLVADVALLFYALFTLAIFKGGLGLFIPAVTLTLPGIAGFILSVGMAVDANILIFERLKEELRNGKPLRQAIDAGFKRAFTAIRDSNICTIITCTILYSMGTPTVKGFALTLGLGVVISLFTAITVTRTLLYLLVDAGAGKHPEWFGLGRQWFGGNRFQEGTKVVANATDKPQLNVVKKRKFFYGLSAAIIVPGIIFYSMGGLKKSIEFIGGTQVEVKFEKPVKQDEINKALEAHGFKDHLVQMASNGEIAYISVRSDAPAPATAKSSRLPMASPFMGRADAAPGDVTTPAATTPAATTSATTTPAAKPAAPAPKPAAAQPTVVAPKSAAPVAKPAVTAPKPVAVSPKPAAAKPAVTAPKPIVVAPKPAAPVAAPIAAPKPAAPIAVTAPVSAPAPVTIPVTSPAAPILPAPAPAMPATPAPGTVVASGTVNTPAPRPGPALVGSHAEDYLMIAFPEGPGATAPASAMGHRPALDDLGVMYTLESHSLVGGVISKELTTNAFYAVIIASTLIVLYLGLAFAIGGFVAGLRFGVSAIAALLHDVLVLIGAFSILGYLFNWQIDSLFITATLTVVGFSVHDTIVIFDRLRENLRHRLTNKSFEDLANRSILQSFARSINTSFTVVLTLLAMFFLGEPSTRLLVVALLIGIVSGTYSSIFNATPILVDWEMWLARREQSRGDRPEAPRAPAAPAPKTIPAPVAPATGGGTLPGSASPSPGRSARPRRGGSTKRF